MDKMDGKTVSVHLDYLVRLVYLKNTPLVCDVLILIIIQFKFFVCFSNLLGSLNYSAVIFIAEHFSYFFVRIAECPQVEDFIVFGIYSCFEPPHAVPRLNFIC